MRKVGQLVWVGLTLLGVLFFRRLIGKSVSCPYSVMLTMEQPLPPAPLPILGEGRMSFRGDSRTPHCICSTTYRENLFLLMQTVSISTVKEKL
jgi:hypothetical protein